MEHKPRRTETLVLFSPELTNEERQGIIDTLTGIVERESGKMLKLDDWGMRDLAYPVNKVMRGSYVRFEYAGPAPLVQELERIIRITDGVFKFLTVKLDHEYEEEAA